jgi:peptide/nickel transport system permease protein
MSIPVDASSIAAEAPTPTGSSHSRGGLLRYAVRRLLTALTTLLFVMVFNFILFRLMPGDPAALYFRGRNASQEAVRKMQQDLNGNKFEQFIHYVQNPFSTDFRSAQFSRPVWDVIGDRVWATLLLLGVSTVLSTVIGVWIGIRGGWRRGSWFDRTSTGVTLTLYSMPEFWLGMMLLVLLATTAGAFPQGGFQSTQSGITGMSKVVDILNHMFLPTLTLTLAYLGEYYILMRSSLLEVLGEEYVTTARAKGIGEQKVLWHHAVRNALLPTVTLVALSFGFVIGGAVTVELVFSYPGLGLLTFEALDTQDYALLQGMFLFFSLAVIIANLAADLLYSYLDPRVREA